MTNPFPSKRSIKKPSEEHWVPLTDLMTGLMMMFMLIALTFMIKVQAESKKTKELKDVAEAQALKMRTVARIYTAMREDLFARLHDEFKDDLPRWSAALDRDLAIRFNQPEILFESQRADLKPKFAEILSDFFPRYTKILSGAPFKASIDEIRIEGHTSSNWIGSASQDQAYMLNMELSQARTRSVLQYVVSLPQVATEQNWLKQHLTANGLSSSKLRYNKDGTEDREGSRRVEFRVRTNADEQIARVLEVSAK